jgi:hypothetical protein
LPGIPLERRYAVLYFPSILASVFVRFVARYTLDQARAKTLTAMAPKMGVSTMALDLYLSGDTVPSQTAVPRMALFAGALAPAVPFLISTATIVTSRGFSEDRAWYIALYASGAVTMVGGYRPLAKVLGVSLRDSVRGLRQKRKAT